MATEELDVVELDYCFTAMTLILKEEKDGQGSSIVFTHTLPIFHVYIHLIRFKIPSPGKMPMRGTEMKRSTPHGVNRKIVEVEKCSGLGSKRN